MTDDKPRRCEHEREPGAKAPRPARNMHADVDETCDDICSCEPEPRWQRVEEENERLAALRGRE